MIARGVALLAALVLGGGLLVGVIYAPRDGLITAAMLAVVGSIQLTLTHVLAAHRRRLGSLARQFQAGIALAVGLSLLGIGAIALAMFVSPHDALVMALLLVFGAAIGGYSASLLAAGVLRDVNTVHDAVRAVGAGEQPAGTATEANDELALLAGAAGQAAETMREREAERDAAWSAHRNLVAAVSHDLRTPLTSLRLLSDAIRDEVGGPEAREKYAGQLSAQVGSLSALVEDLFELSRLEAGQVEWSMQQVRVDQLVEETLEVMSPQVAAKRIALTTSVGAGARLASADPERMQRVLFNLLQNAIRHTPEDGSISLRATTAGELLEIEVRDSGEGIAEEDRERVFQPFFRGSESRTGGGSGLGLAICRAIVEAHGGRIWFDSAPIGALVRVSLPSPA